ncbi:hypothetical protein QR680_005201 [Steinernema hermaphroditum]|uniref:non-specific serine/threonine protein kinase n=1 Tax=Steinernema hermaphroditum TaxID=289476 RepID=A0AA39LV89_9BILA|nr:hypothetical protein QR680_005201 [Steinernema hermaphroditum]
MSEMGKEITTGGDGDQPEDLEPCLLTGRRATMQIGPGDSDSGEEDLSAPIEAAPRIAVQQDFFAEEEMQEPGVSGIQNYPFIHQQAASNSQQNDYTHVLQNIFADGLQFFQPIRIADFDLIDEQKPPGPKIVENYAMGDMLGQGSFGKVKDAVCLHSLRRVAIKIIKLKKNRSLLDRNKKERQIEDVRKEIRIMKNLNHPNVISLLDHFARPEKEKVYLVLEFCVGSIEQLIDHSPQKMLPEFQAHRYFVQLMDGVEYIHSRRVNHNDIKPGNLLLNLMGVLKISDFGTAAELDLFNTDGICKCGGTPQFAPPELADEKCHGNVKGAPVDMWCCGLTLYNFISGTYPFDMTVMPPHYGKLLNEIEHAPIKMPDNVAVSPHLSDLIYGLLEKEAKNRFGIAEVRECYWFRQNHPVKHQLAVQISAWNNLTRERGLSIIDGLRDLFNPEDDDQREEFEEADDIEPEQIIPQPGPSGVAQGRPSTSNVSVRALGAASSQQRQTKSPRPKAPLLSCFRTRDFSND